MKIKSFLLKLLPVIGVCLKIIKSFLVKLLPVINGFCVTYLFLNTKMSWVEIVVFILAFLSYIFSAGESKN